MEVEGTRVKLNRSEIQEGASPINPSWAASQISRFGLERATLNPQLARYAKCPEVLQAAGYTVEIVDEETEAEP